MLIVKFKSLFLCAAFAVGFCMAVAGSAAANVVTIKADLVWDDVGSWLALDRLRTRNHEGNVRMGEVLCMDTAETIVLNDTEGLIATLGVSDLVVVRSGPVTLVAHKSKLNQIRSLVQQVADDYPDMV